MKLTEAKKSDKAKVAFKKVYADWSKYEDLVGDEEGNIDDVATLVYEITNMLNELAKIYNRK